MRRKEGKLTGDADGGWACRRWWLDLLAKVALQSGWLKFGEVEIWGRKAGGDTAQCLQLRLRPPRRIASYSSPSALDVIFLSPGA
ncbi:hypothetical protein V6N11_012016 [Hibiscus sabdariffa]|uniref:Uncharacterized protein n=2 Tax=Hibiscus sabdariffa TaxID=183260 RepID=A0ABR2BHI2_9ROSI